MAPSVPTRRGGVVLRIRFTPDDYARIAFAPRPAPLQELNAALMTMCRPGDDLLLGHWRNRVLRALPRTVDPLAELVPAGRAPSFLDVFADSLPEALEQVRSTSAAGLLPGARLSDGVWEVPGPSREVDLDGRGLLLVPTFHWTGGARLSDLPGRAVAVTYPAGSGLLPRPDGSAGSERPAKVLGSSRAELLHLLGEERTTTELARRLGVSAATVSAHTAALRGAGLITTRRAGKAVLHRRTTLGTLLLG